MIKSNDPFRNARNATSGLTFANNPVKELPAAKPAKVSGDVLTPATNPVKELPRDVLSPATNPVKELPVDAYVAQKSGN